MNPKSSNVSLSKFEKSITKPLIASYEKIDFGSFHLSEEQGVKERSNRASLSRILSKWLKTRGFRYVPNDSKINSY